MRGQEVAREVVSLHEWQSCYDTALTVFNQCLSSFMTKTAGGARINRMHEVASESLLPRAHFNLKYLWRWLRRDRHTTTCNVLNVVSKRSFQDCNAVQLLYIISINLREEQ